MASISAMISLVVIFLATYAYSVPVVPNVQNVTSTIQVENATVDFSLENIVILARRDTSNVAEEKRGNDSIGLSSSSSEDESDKFVQTTDKPSARNFEDSSFSSVSETNEKREADNESFDDGEDKRSFTEDSLSTERNTRRGIEVETFESSTVDDTSVAPTSQVEIARRSDNGQWLADNGQWSSVNSNDNAERKKRSDNGQWLADNGQWSSVNSNENAERKKRSDNGQWLADNGQWSSVNSNDNAERMKRSDNGQWLADESISDAQKRSYEDETSTVEDSSVPTTSEVTHAERDMEQSSSFTAEENEQFNQRALPPMRSSSRNLPVKRGMEPSSSSSDDANHEFNQRAFRRMQRPRNMLHPKRGMEQSSSFSDETAHEFNQRAIGSVEVGELSTIIAATVQSKSSTDEQPSSSTEFIREQVSSTSEYETTVAPVEDVTSTSSSVPSATTGKILAVIPGTISRSQLIVNPTTGTTAGFRPAKQVRLTQGQNQTISEERKPNY